MIMSRHLVRTNRIRKAGLAVIALAAALFNLSAAAEQREFNLTIEERIIQVAPGFQYQVFAFNGQVPGPLIHVKEGDDVAVHVTNNTSLPHTIHWHGIHQSNGNWRNDGVPVVTQKQIEPGDSYTYHWKADKTGSLWYHCHVNVNEHVALRGMWGPLIVDPKNPTPIENKVTKEVIMMLSTWDAEHAEKLGHGGHPQEMSSYFSANAKSFPITQPIRVKKGDVVRIRFYGAGDEIHAMHTHGHDMLITHKDGTPLPNPYYVDTILIGPGERYDAIVEAENPGIFIFHDHVDKHVTNNGQFPGGPITMIEYEGVKPDDYYPWKDINYDPNFYYSESMKQPYGIYDHEGFKGKPLEKRPRRQQ